MPWLKPAGKYTKVNKKNIKVGKLCCKCKYMYAASSGSEYAKIEEYGLGKWDNPYD